MKQIIPKEKMSKKARKELFQQQRGTWGAISPITRVVNSKKQYNRKKARREDAQSFNGGSFCLV